MTCGYRVFVRSGELGFYRSNGFLRIHHFLFYDRRYQSWRNACNKLAFTRNNLLFLVHLETRAFTNLRQLASYCAVDNRIVRISKYTMTWENICILASGHFYEHIENCLKLLETLLVLYWDYPDNKQKSIYLQLVQRIDKIWMFNRQFIWILYLNILIFIPWKFH